MGNGGQLHQRDGLGGMQSLSVLQLWGIFQVRYLTNGDGGGMLGRLWPITFNWQVIISMDMTPQVSWIILLITRVDPTIGVGTCSYIGLGGI